MARFKILRIDPEKIDDRVIEEAARDVLEGKLVVFPTETVYGLGANAFDEQACREIFRVKGRPPDNPLIVHIAKSFDLYRVARDIPELAWKVVERIWPGPVTIVLPAGDMVPKAVTGGRETVAVRMPAHPVALRLIEKSSPLAAPSANKSGRPSPTTAQHVIEDYAEDDVELTILDAGPTYLGVESTIIDLTKIPPILLRPGPFTIEELEKALGVRIVVPQFAKGLGEADSALSPGVKYRHYSPRTHLILVEAESYDDMLKCIRDLLLSFSKQGKKVAILATIETNRELRTRYPDIEGLYEWIQLGSRANPYTVASRLYDALRALDKAGVEIGIVESFEERGLGLAIMNRLRKAAHSIHRA